MPDTLTTITNLITSPPGQIAAGGLLAGIVWKFFERVDAVLSDQTKFEIAVWLVGRKKISPVIQSWPETFANVFDRVFGIKHLSWRCFHRSAIASVGSLTIAGLCCFFLNPSLFHTMTSMFRLHWLIWAGIVVVANILPDYLSLLESRYALSKMRQSDPSVGRMRWASIAVVFVSLDIVITFFLAALASELARGLWDLAYSGILLPQAARKGKDWGALANLQQAIINMMLIPQLGARSWLWIYPAFFTSIWVWLYAGSGFLLRAARRFDIGFAWFNRKFDIEKHPLSAIGLVAGAIVAVLWWTVVAVRWLVA